MVLVGGVVMSSVMVWKWKKLNNVDLHFLVGENVF